MAEDNLLESFPAPVGATRTIAVLAMAALLVAARGYETYPWTIVLLPSADVPGPEMVLAPGGIVTRSPLARAPVATLQEPVSVAIASIEQSLPAGTQLFFVSVGGEAAARLERVPETWCARQNVNAGTAMRAILDHAAFGLLSPLNRSGAFSTHCFIDADGDGRLDTAFLSGARREADLAPRPVGPLAVAIERGLPVEGVAEGRIVYAGPDRRGRRLSFRIETVDANGRQVQRETRAEVDVRNLPYTAQIQGATLAIRGYDPATRSVRLRLIRPMAPGGFGFTPPAQVTYVPVFVPR